MGGWVKLKRSNKIFNTFVFPKLLKDSKSVQKSEQNKSKLNNIQNKQNQSSSTRVVHV
jgi:hypothetical protein